MGSNDDDSYRMFGQAAERIAALEAENARLRAALKPFAGVGQDCIDSGFNDGDDSQIITFGFEFRSFRAAAEALKESPHATTKD